MEHRLDTVSSVALVLGLGLALPTTSRAQPADAALFPSARPAATAASEGRAEANLDRMIDAELRTPGGLTADEVSRRAAETSPNVSGRGAELSAASAGLERATLAYLPTTTLTGRYTRLSDTQNGSLGQLVAAPGVPPGPLPAGAALVNVPLSIDNPLNQYVLQVGVSVPVSDYLLRLRSARRAAEHGVASASDNLAASQRRTAADARLVYYDWVRARLVALVADQALAQARAHLADAHARFRVGSLSSADVLRLESQVAQNELAVTTAQNQSALGEERLRTLQHDSTSRAYRIGEDVRRPLPDASPRTLPLLWAEALRSRPELCALSADSKSQLAQAAVERASYVPRLDAFANAQYSNPNSRVFPQTADFRGSWDVGAQLTWVLSDAASAGARSAVAEARARALDDRRNELVDAIRIEVLSADQGVRQAAVARDTSARGLAAAEESYRARRLLYQNGRATTVELLDAETDLIRARLDALGAWIDTRAAAVRLAYAVGR